MLYQGTRLPEEKGNPHLQLQPLSQLQSASSPVPPPPDHGRRGLTLSESAAITTLERRWAGITGPQSLQDSSKTCTAHWLLTQPITIPSLSRHYTTVITKIQMTYTVATNLATCTSPYHHQCTFNTPKLFLQCSTTAGLCRSLT